MRCDRCGGSGRRIIRFGKPGFNPRVDGVLIREDVTTEGKPWRQYRGGGYTTYKGVWCVHEEKDCPVCLGFGTRPDRDNNQAGKKVHFNADGTATTVG